MEQNRFWQAYKLRPYAVKLLLDEEPTYELDKLISRIIGANTAREVIEKYGYQHIFKVPRKWIYALPLNPAPLSGTFRKNFILVEDEIDILQRKENYPKWKSDAVTHEILDAVFILLTEAGLYDSVYAFNMPFCEDGRIAVIDTELHHGWPIHYERFSAYLSHEMKSYWRRFAEQAQNQ